MTMNIGTAAFLFIAVAVVTYLFVSTYERRAKQVYTTTRVSIGTVYLVVTFFAIITFITSGNLILIGLGLLLTFFVVLRLLLDYYSPVRRISDDTA